MQHNPKIIVDVESEIYDLIQHCVDGSFWDFSQHELIADAIYVIGRDQFNANLSRIADILDNRYARIILSNPAEGSNTLRQHIRRVNMQQYVYNGQLLLISGGDMGPQWDYLLYEHFLPKILDYEENLNAITYTDQIYSADKPYKFLFLNGRIRPHRKYLIERWQRNNLLDNALWSNLDSGPAGSRYIHMWDNDQDLMLSRTQIKYLPDCYEYPTYRKNIGRTSEHNFIKHELFAGNWGEIYIEPKAYIDTFFSVVTETVFDYIGSFRTEKIWKPIAMGHPWIAVANSGYYQDLKNLGFQTFGHVIDEHFDFIEVPQDRIEYIARIVEDLCQQDLAAFLAECYNVCRYNQQHLAEMSKTVRKQFPGRFLQYIKAHGWMI